MNWSIQRRKSSRIWSDIFSAIIIVEMFVLAHGTDGMIEASTTLSPGTP
jgi:hypothetical protein